MLPFTLALPYVSLFWTGVLSVIIGFILASAFSAILVYAQELLPGRVGHDLGTLLRSRLRHRRHRRRGAGPARRRTSIEFVYHLCSYLPALGLLTAFLPNVEAGPTRARPADAADVGADAVPSS